MFIIYSPMNDFDADVDTARGANREKYAGTFRHATPIGIGGYYPAADRGGGGGGGYIVGRTSTRTIVHDMWLPELERQLRGKLKRKVPVSAKVLEELSACPTSGAEAETAFEGVALDFVRDALCRQPQRQGTVLCEQLRRHAPVSLKIGTSTSSLGGKVLEFGNCTPLVQGVCVLDFIVSTDPRFFFTHPSQVTVCFLPMKYCHYL
jgi:hypothetical protein